MTSPELSGLSVILPDNFFSKLAEENSPDLLRKVRRLPEALLNADRSSDHAVIASAMRLGRAVARRDPSCSILAAQLLDQLEQTLASGLATASRSGSLGSRRRWQVVREASRWMQAHLAEPFRIGDVATALDTPMRTIQQAFADELGRPPLVQAKLMRLHLLRRRLQDPRQHTLAIARQMAACGLPASGETARAYFRLFGEQPNQTKRNGRHR
ncbi:MAG: hypothetical protein VKO39_09260 [Cyanobacteriota bacterium]|nr:hypothetical protein [Cyanobacteriota bacterium]